MSYLKTSAPGFLPNLLRRKEFFAFKASAVRNFRDPPDALPEIGTFLKIHSHQLAVRNFMNINTPYKRLHLSHQTGTGKTLAAIAIAQECIKIYKKLYAAAAAKLPAIRSSYTELDKTTPTVFVLGFGGTKAAFIRDLLRNPEFGFVTPAEREELQRRQRAADAGLADDIKHLREYYAMLKKRITNKAKGGFYKFYGYDEFVNRLFLGSVSLTDLETLATQKLRAEQTSGATTPLTTLEDIIYAHIADGSIQVNQTLLAQFENSLLICDEIHNTYNMNMRNNRGVAIQFILDTVKSLRFLSMSATPINNSPTEVVELVNYHADRKITKREFFVNNRTLHPGKLEELGRLMAGKISFLQDVNIKYFPRREFVGETMVLPGPVGDKPAGTQIPYLKFIACPMSEYHQAAYQHYVTSNAAKESESLDDEATGGPDQAPDDMISTAHEVAAVTADGETEDTEVIGDAPVDVSSAIPTDGYSVYDMVFPGPERGLFRSAEIRQTILGATQEWRDANGIMIKKFSATNSVITGDFLRRDRLVKYSTKYSKMLDTVLEVIRSSKGDVKKCRKIMWYHDRVKMSGVLAIQELLKQNDILDETTEPVENTLCCLCGYALKDHNSGVPSGARDGHPPDITPHDFRPVRFVIAHSDLDKTVMDQSLARINTPENAHGTNFMILVGSKIVKESYDFKEFQVLLISLLPTNIATLIQVFGRCIRKGSHVNLPPELRVVRIYIYMSTVNTAYPSVDPVSPEMRRYVDKLADYISIQEIERELNRIAIDADINRDIIMPPAILAEYFPGKKPSEYATGVAVNSIGNMYFEPAVTTPAYTAADLATTTFNAYLYNEEEIRTILIILKRLFAHEFTWTYDDLWAAVRAPPMGLETNPALFAEGNFIIALDNLVSNATPIISLQKRAVSEIVRLFDPNERYIYKAGSRYKVEHIGKYYIAFPVAEITAHPLNMVYSEYTEHVRDKERAMIRNITESELQVVRDVETYRRYGTIRKGLSINIDAYVRESKADANYLSKKAQFIDLIAAEPGATPHHLDTQFLTDYSAQFQMLFVEDAIVALMVADGDLGTPALVAYRYVIDLLAKFDSIITLAEVKKYKDTAKQFKAGLPELSPSTPIGYMATKSVRIFDPQGSIDAQVAARGQWLEINKLAMNRHPVYRENDIIVGYLESADDSMKFKLRKPSQQIRDEVARITHLRKATKSEEGRAVRVNVGDTRLIERGIVCMTKEKGELIRIADALKIFAPNAARAPVRIRSMCDAIRSRLIELEIHERKERTRVKYFYSWWNEPLNIQAL